MTTDLHQEIAAFREKRENATAGEWHRHDLHIHARYDSGGLVRHYAVVDALQHHCCMQEGDGDANAAFIAAAANDAVRLLTDAEAALTEARDEIAFLRSEPPRAKIIALEKRLAEAERLLRHAPTTDEIAAYFEKGKIL